MTAVNLDLMSREEIVALARKSIAMIAKQSNDAYFIEVGDGDDDTIYMTSADDAEDSGLIYPNDIEDRYWRFVSRGELMEAFQNRS